MTVVVPPRPRAPTAKWGPLNLSSHGEQLFITMMLAARMLATRCRPPSTAMR